MAIAPTGAIYKSLFFDGEDSRDYGVYITGEAVFNAPEREVEMISIPGRNGAFALDKGRFENIEVTYPAGIFADSETDFTEAISDFRNMLCSKRGYVRLQDEYNPNEYRMAIYKSGLEVDPAMLRAGEFEITFDCKPQRWLTSGETAVSVDSGDTLTNPTRFESSPILNVSGYGDIEFNDYTISIENRPLGRVTMLGLTDALAEGMTIQPAYAQLNNGDPFTVNVSQWAFAVAGGVYPVLPMEVDDSNANVLHCYDYVFGKPPVEMEGVGGGSCNFYIQGSVPFTKGTTETVENITTLSIGSSASQTITQHVTYDATAGTIQLSYTFASTFQVDAWQSECFACDIDSVKGTSSITQFADFVIDCDLGVAYVPGTEIVDLNGYIDLGSDLPVLATGSNEFTISNTITDFSVTPRWWKI